MNPRTIASYGGPYQNEEPVVDPVSEVDAPYFDRMLEDTAQLTKATGFTWFSFLTTTGGGGIIPAANVNVSGVWGQGTAQKPVVEKISTGIYTLTWPATFADALVPVANMSAVAETQSVAFTFASGLNNTGATNGTARVYSIASNVITVRIYDDASPAQLSDLSGTAMISGYLR